MHWRVLAIILFQYVAADMDFDGVVNDMVAISSSSTSYSYTLLDNGIEESLEMFNLVLSVGVEVSASVSTASSIATISIIDNDCEFLY